jgi:dihydroorotase
VQYKPASCLELTPRSCAILAVKKPLNLRAGLDMLRPGDILTHCYTGNANLAGQATNIVQDGKLLPAAREAKQRGVVFDVGHGGGSFDFRVAEAAIQQGCLPDTISSDVHTFSSHSRDMPHLTYLPWVMGTFLALGFTLDQVIAMTTSFPGRVINRNDKLGTLQIGAPAEVSVLELTEAPARFVAQGVSGSLWPSEFFGSSQPKT